MNPKTELRLTRTDADLEGVLSLQRANLRKHLSDAEAAEQGFLIAEYSMEQLRAMHHIHPSAIAVDGETVVGFALATPKEVRGGHALLSVLFDQIDTLEFDRRALRDADYIVIGQLCVAKDYRGFGLVQRLYRLFRESLQGTYRYAITEVARANRRSLKAHLNTGFRVIHTIEDCGLEWDIVLWDWTAANPAD